MKRDFKATMGVRFWALRNVFLLWFVSPSVIEVNERRCVVRVPLNWRTRNHLGSMYFGALAIGADIAGGLIAFHLMEARKIRASFVFKDLRAEFLKRPESDVLFTCEDGTTVQELLERTESTGERQETLVHVVATAPDTLGDEAVARFQLTLSLKKSARQT
jgi:acyl-coenzyme A thioesterase PaaI-like protein